MSTGRPAKYPFSFFRQTVQKEASRNSKPEFWVTLYPCESLQFPLVFVIIFKDFGKDQFLIPNHLFFHRHAPHQQPIADHNNLEEDTNTKPPMKIDMTEAMDSIMENISGRIDAMLANKIAEALTRTISRTRVQATDQDVNMADSCKKPSAKSHNSSTILETPSSHNGDYS